MAHALTAFPCFYVISSWLLPCFSALARDSDSKWDTRWNDASVCTNLFFYPLTSYFWLNSLLPADECILWNFRQQQHFPHLYYLYMSPCRPHKFVNNHVYFRGFVQKEWIIEHFPSRDKIVDWLNSTALLCVAVNWKTHWRCCCAWCVNSPSKLIFSAESSQPYLRLSRSGFLMLNKKRCSELCTIRDKEEEEEEKHLCWGECAWCVPTFLLTGVELEEVSAQARHILMLRCNQEGAGKCNATVSLPKQPPIPVSAPHGTRSQPRWNQVVFKLWLEVNWSYSDDLSASLSLSRLGFFAIHGTRLCSALEWVLPAQQRLAVRFT